VKNKSELDMTEPDTHQ